MIIIATKSNITIAVSDRGTFNRSNQATSGCNRYAMTNDNTKGTIVEPILSTIKKNNRTTNTKNIAIVPFFLRRGSIIITDSINIIKTLFTKPV